MKAPRLALWLALAVAALASSASATVIVTLKDGSQISGSLQDVQPQSLLLQSPSGQTQAIGLSLVAQVTTANGTVVYQGQADSVPPPATAPAATPPLAPAVAAQVTASAAPLGVTPAPALSPPMDAIPAGAPTPLPKAAATSPAASTARIATSRTLSWAGGGLIISGAALTFIAVTQVDQGAENALGAAAAISAGLGLLHLWVGSLILPDADVPDAALLNIRDRQLGLGLPPLDLGRFGGVRTQLLSATF